MKVCKGCQENKPFTEYHKQGKGLKSKCKPCRLKESKNYYYQDHEKTKESKRATWHKMELKKILKQREI